MSLNEGGLICLEVISTLALVTLAVTAALPYIREARTKHKQRSNAKRLSELMRDDRK